ncbi:variant erythrocyte surface antigen-1 family protein, partial [Babesia divergens]
MAPHKSLLVCPKNLKECIDWVLRATGKDDLKGTNDIVKLKDALKAELGGSGLTGDLKTQLTELASGLGFLAGLPACLCKTKESVKEGLKKIYEELKTSLISCLKSKLNCDSCSIESPCKCCVIQSINKVKDCPCLKGNKTPCHCNGQKVSCAKVLAGLEACLHLQCLQSDMNEICRCSGSECCQSGTCDGKSGVTCDFCQKLNAKTPQPTTGLGLSPPNPIRLAGRLEKFFGSSGQGPKSGCTCTCNGSTPDKSCCCLACETGNCSQFCNSECRSKGSSHQSSTCPCKAFCIKINDFKIAAQAADRTCCSGGTQCHCGLDGSGPSKQKCQATSGLGSSGQGCCIERSGKNYKHSVKCMIRRLVSYFKSLKSDISSPSIKNFKNCCELMCVLKTCEFLKGFLTKGKCGKCTSEKTCKGSSSGTSSCCKGNFSTCASDPNCCLGCQDCCALKFRNALETLRFAGPCGQDLWRTLDSFLNFIRFVFLPKVKLLEKLIKEARDKCSQCKTGHSSCPDCKSGSSGSSSCQGCAQVLTLLQTHKDVLSLMTRGYFSSYTYRFVPFADPPAKSTYASWDSLSPGEQKKAAKIFLGMLPCMYWGLKILYDRSQDPVTWPDWQYISMDSNDKPSSDLAKFFYAWGYGLDPLKSKKGFDIFPILGILFSSGSLNSLFETSKKYFSRSLSSGSSKSQPSPPTTVREMLLWLYGLRFHKHFSELVENCKSLCSPFGNSFNSDAFCYYVHTCCFILPLSIISFIEDSSSALSLISSSSDWQKFSYPEDLSSLFEKLCEYARKIFVALNFLSIQCKNGPSQAGWQSCYFGGSCKKALGNSLASTSVSSASSGCSCPNSKTYLCTGKASGTDAHDHCKDGQTCLGFGSSVSCSVHPPKSGSSHSSSQCPHPLQAFLCHSKPNSDSESYPFGLSGIVPMGFSKENLSSTARDGWSLYHVIEPFCTNGFYPLTRLLQFSLCVSRYPPETLGEFFAFFRRFKDSPVFKNNFADYVSGEPGSYPGGDLKDALVNFIGSGSHSGSHSNDLKSLHGCHVPTSTSTCGQYLYPLTYNVYNNNIFINDFLDTYLSWVCYSAEKFKEKLEEFHTEFSDCCSSGSSCTKIVHCPCALPFI